VVDRDQDQADRERRDEREDVVDCAEVVRCAADWMEDN
jgi:hypothetical protein